MNGAIQIVRNTFLVPFDILLFESLFLRLNDLKCEKSM